MPWFVIVLCGGFLVFMPCLSYCSDACRGLDSAPGNCTTIGNCTAETGWAPSIVECRNRPQNSHICTFEIYPKNDPIPKELGVKVADNVFQLPEAHFTASSNEQDVKYARIGQLPTNKTWCATDSDASPWLQIDLGIVGTVARIELEPVGNTNTINFTVSYKDTGMLAPPPAPPPGGNQLTMYLSGRKFTSTANSTCHHLFIQTGTDTIRINSDTSKPCFRVAVYGNPPARLAAPTELGVRVPAVGDASAHFRIPDSDFSASSNQGDAKYARIGLPNERAWCAANNDNSPWLQIILADIATAVERIDVQGKPNDNFEIKFWLSYNTKSGGSFINYRNKKIFISKNGRSTHYISIGKPYSIRINANPPSKPCLRVAIYGNPIPQKDNPIKEVVQVVPVPVTTLPAAIFLGQGSLSSSDFHNGYVIWVIFLAVFVFLLLVFFTFLFCWCCRREREFQRKSEKVTRVTDVNYVPSWRKIDEKAEKGYLATQEVQEVKIAFSDEYIPPDLKKEKLDPNDEDNYRHKIFSFKGWEGPKTPAIKVEKSTSIHKE